MKTPFLILAAATILGLSAQAQVSAYGFTQNIGSYGAANSGTQVGPLMQDDDVTPLNLPFPFTYNGTTYTTVNVCSNGYISFANLSGTEYQAISDPATQQVIAPFAQDLFMGTVIMADLSTGSNTLSNCSSVAGFSVGDVILDWSGDFGSVNPTVTAISAGNIVVNVNATSNVSAWDVLNMNGYIKQSVSGSSPNQICELEYRNMTRFAVYDEVINFKLRLHQAGNQIEFLYGTMIPGTDITPSEVGLKGNSNSDFKSRTVGSSNTWSNSTASALISDACAFESGNFPLSGQRYLWAASSCTPPSISVAQSNSAVCSGSSATLTASGAATYTWSTGSNSTSIVVSPSASAVYTLSAGSSTCAASLTTQVLVNALPTLSVSSSHSILCNGNSATLTASGANAYTWSPAGSSSSVNPVMVVSPAATTIYTLTGSNGSCTAKANITLSVTACTGLGEFAKAGKGLEAYPNPFSGELQLSNQSGVDGLVLISDALGKEVYKAGLRAGEVLNINTESYTKGMYLVQLRTADQVSTKKLIRN
ncbi:MAG TPA: T9SS type A sorting domain-containing protein [Bacteroidia bacterium]|nr:T9SS type A sorting domain-containing protein [Bacteroidia bacterium]